MVIPNGLTDKEGGGLELKLQCYHERDEFDGDTPAADYYALKKWTWHTTVHTRPCLGG